MRGRRRISASSSWTSCSRCKCLWSVLYCRQHRCFARTFMVKQVRDLLIREQSFENCFGTRQPMFDLCKMPGTKGSAAKPATELHRHAPSRERCLPKPIIETVTLIPLAGRALWYLMVAVCLATTAFLACQAVFRSSL
jgi:hypothetical protein